MEEYEKTEVNLDIKSKIANILTDNVTIMTSVFSLLTYSEMTTSEDEDSDWKCNDLESIDDRSEMDSELLKALTIEHNFCFAHTL